MTSDLRAALERHQVMPPDSDDEDRCDECALIWPCDAARALEALDAAETQLRDITDEQAALYQQTMRERDAAEQERDGAIEEWHSALSERDAAEAQVAALVEALRECQHDLWEDWADQGPISDRPKVDHLLSDLSAAAAEHDAKVAREAVAAERERLRGAPMLRLTGEQLDSICPAIEGDWTIDFDEFEEFLPVTALLSEEAER